MDINDQEQQDAPDATTVFERRLILVATALLLLTLVVPALI